jgi:hypothetical protein
MNLQEPTFSSKNTEIKEPFSKSGPDNKIQKVIPPASTPSSGVNLAPKSFYSSSGSSKIATKVEASKENLLEDIDNLQLGKPNSTEAVKNTLKRCRQESSENLATNSNADLLFKSKKDPQVSCISTHKRTCTNASNRKIYDYYKFENQENLESPSSPVKKWNRFEFNKTSGKG